MHILHLTPWYPNPAYPLEGIFVQSQVYGQKRFGLQPGIYHVQLDYPHFRSSVFPKAVTCREGDGLPVLHLSGGFPPRINAWLLRAWAYVISKYFKLYCEAFGMPDIIHAHTYLGAVAARAICKARGIPYVVTLHETSLMTGSYSPWRRFMIRAALEEARYCLPVSHSLRDSLHKQFQLTNLGVIPNFIDVGLFDLPPAPPPPSPFRFVAVGDLLPRKRIDLLIHAFAKMETETSGSFQLDIIGSGSEEGRLKALVQEIGLTEKVRFYGMMPPSGVARQLQQEHCLVLPSALETFGIVVAEAMACGLPVVATDCGGPADLVTPDTGKLVPVDDPAALAQAMRAVYLRYDTYAPLQIRRHAISLFSEAAVIPQLKALYRAIAE